MNCGAVGKADHDGDPAVHYATIELPAAGPARLAIERVTYEHEAFARAMEGRGISPVFVEPVRTGIWTIGVASLPSSERHRYLRAGEPELETGRPATPEHAPELLAPPRFREVLAAFRDLRLVSAAESDEIERMLDPAFPFFAAMRLATSVHVHVKVDDVATLPHAAIRALGTAPENERPGYVKYPFAGGLNMIFSSIDVAEEDLLPPEWERRARPHVDHTGIDLRRETGLVRAAFDDAPAIAQRIGWAHVQQGGRGQPVFCCHVVISGKHWVYPPAEESPFTRPVELAYGPLEVRAEVAGCDLRPIDPRHPAAPEVAACVARHAAHAEAAVPSL